jgi:hypothetical protein
LARGVDAYRKHSGNSHDAISRDTTWVVSPLIKRE